MTDLVQEYMEKGEEWENDPQQYVAAFSGDRDAYSDALDEVDYFAMVEQWSDDTIYSVNLAGSDLAFNKDQRVAIGDAANAESAKRWKANGGYVPSRPGMGEDGKPIA